MYDCGIMQVILQSGDSVGGVFMCCRFYIRENDPEMTALVDAALQSPLMAQISKKHPATLVRSGEVFPTNLVAAVATNRQMQPAVFPMLWGFTIQGRKTAIVNARTETAAEKPNFRESWKTHRCIVPASWYYEWQHVSAEDGKGTAKTKYAIQPKDASITYLCGLYRIENRLPCFVILTREPSADVAHIHDRMPLILPKEAINDWVNPAVNPEDVLPYALTSMVAEKA